MPEESSTNTESAISLLHKLREGVPVDCPDDLGVKLENEIWAGYEEGETLSYINYQLVRNYFYQDSRNALIQSLRYLTHALEARPETEALTENIVKARQYADRLHENINRAARVLQDPSLLSVGIFADLMERWIGLDETIGVIEKHPRDYEAVFDALSLMEHYIDIEQFEQATACRDKLLALGYSFRKKPKP